MKTKLIEHDGMTFEVVGDGKRKTILEYGDGSNLRADWVVCMEAGDPDSALTHLGWDEIEVGLFENAFKRPVYAIDLVAKKRCGA